MYVLYIHKYSTGTYGTVELVGWQLFTGGAPFSLLRADGSMFAAPLCFSSLYYTGIKSRWSSSPSSALFGLLL